ncbi:MAG: hypothetical protein ACREI6_06580, partial [Candidatus Rokuibacteriota bacterium]
PEHARGDRRGRGPRVRAAGACLDVSDRSIVERAWLARRLLHTSRRHRNNDGRRTRMGQVNVNTPGGGGTEPVGEPPGSSSTGFILGIIIAILVIAALVYFLLLAPPAGAPDGGTDGNGDTNGDTNGEPAPTGWVLVDRA